MMTWLVQIERIMPFLILIPLSSIKHTLCPVNKILQIHTTMYPTDYFETVLAFVVI